MCDCTGPVASAPAPPLTRDGKALGGIATATYTVSQVGGLVDTLLNRMATLSEQDKNLIMFVCTNFGMG